MKLPPKPWWLPGGHLQTIWPALWRRSVGVRLPDFRRERWPTPDGDFIDVDFLPAPASCAPLLVMFHGLEGSSASSYCQTFARVAQSIGWCFAVPHFRGCSGELNLAPRAYHSGDFEEIDWILARFLERTRRPVFAVGISLGGNALLRWAQEAGSTAARRVYALAAVCAPLDLVAGGHALGRGVGRQLYTRLFLRSMKPKALAKLRQYPGLFDRHRLQAARTLYEFDDVFTAPLHGFRNVDDYWLRASAKPRLREIQVPTLILNACNDPFVPYVSLPRVEHVSSQVKLWQPLHGGHVGFVSGSFPGHSGAMPDAVVAWLEAHNRQILAAVGSIEERPA